MSKQILKMTNNLKMMNMVKTLATKVIPVLLVFVVSTEAFAGTYQVTNLSDVPALIKADIENQEATTNIIYNGSETFSSKSDALDMIRALDKETTAILGAFDLQNIFSSNVKGSTSEVSSGVFKIQMGQYNYEYKNSKSDLASADQIIDNIVNDIKSVSTNEYETIQAIYDYVIKTYSYQKWSSSDTDFPNVINERNILLGLQGKGVVCDAYAMLLCRMFDKAGIENKFVMGSVQGGLHIWNIVKLEGVWYHIDATWGDDDQDYYNKYFLAGDTNISNYHVWDKTQYPETSATAYDPKALGNEILGKLQVVESKSYSTIPEVDVALNELATLKNQANEVVDTTLRGTVFSEISRIETDLEQLKATIGANNETLLVQNATLAVEKAETSLVLTDYNSALALVNALTDSIEKTDLINRLNAVYQTILAKDEAQAIALATQAVVTSEQSLTEADYNSALALVNALKDGSDKTDLLNRLDAVKLAMDTQADNKALELATQAVELAESTLSRTHYNNAVSLVNDLKDSTDKEDLLRRLEVVLTTIEAEEKLQVLKEATNAVLLAEETLSLDNYNKALSMVNALDEGTDKNSLLDRLSAVKNTIDNLNEAEKDALAFKQATNAVEKAEKTLLATDYSTALALVDGLKDSSDKVALIGRLEVVKETIILNEENSTIQNATEAVAKAESSLAEADYASALSLVNALKDGTTKTELLERLEAVKVAIENGSQKDEETEEDNDGKEDNEDNVDSDNTIDNEDNVDSDNTVDSDGNVDNATEAVVKAEKSLSSSDYSNAFALVNALENGSIKTTLLSRLDAVKKAIDQQSKNTSIEEATNAVNRAERSLAYSDYKSALSSVRALVDSETKTNLLSRLDTVKKAIDRNDEEREEEEEKLEEEYYATKAVKKAEKTLDEDDYEYARKLINRLSKGRVKNRLLDRLEDVNIEIDNLLNPINEAKEAEKLAVQKQAISNRTISNIIDLYSNGYNLGAIYAKGSSNKINGFITNPGASNSVNNRNMLFLPIRTIATINGYSVSSDQAGTIVLKNSENTVILKSNHFIYNGKTLQYQVAPIKRNGTSYINAEFLAQYVGLDISYTVGSSIMVTVD